MRQLSRASWTSAKVRNARRANTSAFRLRWKRSFLPRPWGWRGLACTTPKLEQPNLQRGPANARRVTPRGAIVDVEGLRQAITAAGIDQMPLHSATLAL